MPETSPARGRAARSPGPRRRSLPLASLANAAGALLAFGGLVFPRPLHLPGSAPAPGARPHLSIERVDSLTTDPRGRIYRRLEAAELRRMTPGAVSMLVRPRLTMFPAAGPRWRFEAERGEVSPDGKNIYLPGPVKGRRDALEPLEIDGRDFRLMAASHYGESDEPATVRGPSFEARGTGVRFWLEEGRIELLADARGVLQPR